MTTNMADNTNSDVTRSRINAERYFDLKKKQGISLVRRGKLCKKDYYTRIRQIGIDTSIIEPDEYPGEWDDGWETFFELSLGLPGYIYGFALGGPAGGAVGFGGGSASGQVLFDSLNKISADEGEITKPGSQITTDALKQFGVDATLSYGIDKAVIPLAKGGYGYVAGLTGKGKDKVNKVFGKMGGWSKEKKDAFVKKYGADALSESKVIRETNLANLEREGLPASKYQMLKNDPLGGNILTGTADATGLVPGADIFGRAAFKSQENRLLESLTSRLDPTKVVPGFTGRIEARDPIIREGVFGRNFLGGLERGSLRPKGFDKDGNIISLTKQDEVPLFMLNSMNNIVKKNTKEASKLYSGGNAMLRGTGAVDDFIAKYGAKEALELGITPVATKFSLGAIRASDGQVVAPGITAQVEALNAQLLSIDGKTGLEKISKELPGYLKKYIQPKSIPFKLEGIVARKATTKPVPTDLSGKEIFELQQLLKNQTQSGKYFTKSAESMTPYESTFAKFIPKIQGQLRLSIGQGSPKVSSMLKGADDIYKNNVKLLRDNEKLTAYARGIDDTGYNKEVYGEAVKGMQRVLSKEAANIPTFAGEGLVKAKPTSEQVFDYYLKDATNIKKLKHIMVNNPRLTPEQKLRGEQEFANIMYSQVEDVFDRTLIESLRVRGEFNTVSLLKEMGVGSGAKATDKIKFQTIINETKNLSGIKELNRKLKATNSELVPHMENLTYDRVITFAKSINGFKPLPETAKFLIRGTALRLSSGATLSKLLPIAGAGAGAIAVGGFSGALATIGLLNLFNGYMRSKVGQSYFAQMAKNKSPKLISQFFKGMFESPSGKKAIMYSNWVARSTRQGTLVGAGQDLPHTISDVALDAGSRYLGLPTEGIPRFPKAPNQEDTAKTRIYRRATDDLGRALERDRRN